MTALRCHFCQEERPDLVQSPRDPSMWWCPPDDTECNFRARRRLGVRLVVALEAKARELEAQGAVAAGPFLDEAARVRWRIGRILSSEPPARTAEYVAHISSPAWDAFRVEQRLHALHRCEGCGQVVPDLHLHHLTYERIGSELPRDVLVVCGSCHPRWDDARRAYYRESEYSKVVPVDAVYGDLLTDDVRARISERIATASRTETDDKEGARP